MRAIIHYTVNMQNFIKIGLDEFSYDILIQFSYTIDFVNRCKWLTIRLLIKGVNIFAYKGLIKFLHFEEKLNTWSWYMKK